LKQKERFLSRLESATGLLINTAGAFHFCLSQQLEVSKLQLEELFEGYVPFFIAS
jgi:hypothetical protein